MFLIAVAGKITSWGQFLTDISRFHFIPDWAIILVALAVVSLEAFTGILLLCKEFIAGSFTGFVLAAGFLASSWFRDPASSAGGCACFGDLFHPSQNFMNGLNVLNSILCLFILLQWKSKTNPQSKLKPQITGRTVSLAIILLLLTFCGVLAIYVQPDVRNILAVSYLSATRAVDPDVIAARNYNMANDPMIGQSAPAWDVVSSTGLQVQRSHLLSHSPALVLFIGHCSSCAMNGIRPWLELNIPFKVIIITSDQQSGVDWLNRQLRGRAIVLRDQRRHTNSAYNVAWIPRVFLIDAEEHLIFKEERKEHLSQSIQRLKHTAERLSNSSTWHKENTVERK